MLKVTEAIMSKLYKGTLYNCDLGMFRVNASMSVPEDYSQDRLFEWGLNDKKEFQVTFDMELRSFMPVFESGILWPESDVITREAIKSNPNASGIGQLRSDSDGNMGIFFGGVFQRFVFSDDNIKVAPNNNMLSNESYNSTTSKEAGGPYDLREIDSSLKIVETPSSKNYRNAKNDEG